MDPATLIPLGFLDGLNICSLSILALFLSLLFTTNANRGIILLTGSIYILGVFTSYLATGFGLLSFALAIPTVPHFLARVGAGMLIFVGSANMLNYYRPGALSLDLAPWFTSRVLRYVKPAGLPTAGVAGLFAGVHNFPCACTGGIYLSFISLIADSADRLLYLVLYIAAAVTPLLAILLLSSSKTVTLSLRRWQQANSAKFLFTLGIVMLSIGILILVTIATGTDH